ncbi:MAG: SDR family NAD(P)-dependent oxidoreductase, partial [Rhodococcus sp. (in: high G+C Gram-positive bacteria)]
MFRSRSRVSYGAHAVVTGAGSGIGRAFAVELSRRGGTVICADISLERAEETVRLLSGPGFAVRCDVADRSQV